MQASDIPTLISEYFAKNASGSFIRTVPTTTTTPGAASFDQGFPSECFVDPNAGGFPPNGADFNYLYQLNTRWLQWVQAGGAPVMYNSTFQTAIGGYPKGAVVGSLALAGLYWRSTVDNNTTNPDASGAGWTPAFSAFPGFTVLVSGTAWVAPAGVFILRRVKVWGGGGGGAAAAAGNNGGGGGGGCAIGFNIAVVPGTSYIYFVGAGGAGASSFPNSGSPGGSSGITLGARSLTGQGGLGGTSNDVAGGGASGGDINMTGGGGQVGRNDGGSGIGGFGGTGGAGGGTGALSAPGGGGSPGGGGAGVTGGISSNNGAPGAILMEW